MSQDAVADTDKSLSRNLSEANVPLTVVVKGPKINAWPNEDIDLGRNRITVVAIQQSKMIFDSVWNLDGALILIGNLAGQRTDDDIHARLGLSDRQDHVAGTVFQPLSLATTAS